MTDEKDLKVDPEDLMPKCLEDYREEEKSED